MKPQIKRTAEERRSEILGKALELAEKVGYNRVTREALGERLGYASSSLIAHHMGSAADLKRKIMREAVRTENLAVVAQGLVLKDRVALKAPEDLRTRALESLVN